VEVGISLVIPAIDSRNNLIKRASRYERLFEKPLTSTVLVTRSGNTISITQTTGAPAPSPQEIKFVTRPLWQRYIEPIDAIERLFNNGMRLFGSPTDCIAELENLDFLSKRSEDPIARLRSANISQGLNFVVPRVDLARRYFFVFLPVKCDLTVWSMQQLM
jgi:hypothetical protein